jgi:serine O-acetyltransferase
VINPKAAIGENCNISQGVTIGIVNGGKKAGVPTIGNRVYIGPGAKIVGSITIGNDVAVGANAVVVSNVPDGVTVGGIPAKIISNNDSSAYINRVLSE